MSDYPYSPGFENRDTSYAAAQTVDTADLHKLVLNLHKQADGLTDAELDAHKPAGCPTLRPRRCELTKQGLIVDTGLRRLSPAKRPMIVWGLPNPNASAEGEAPK